MLNRSCKVVHVRYVVRFFFFFFFFFLIFILNCKVLTYNTYLQTMYDTYATNRTILYLQKKKKKTYLQCEILTLLTILYSTYNTKLAILTMRCLHYLKCNTPRFTYIKQLLALLTLRITYATKTEKKKRGGGKVWQILVNCSSNSKEKKEIKDIFSADSRKLALYTSKVEARKIGRECLVGRKV